MLEGVAIGIAPSSRIASPLSIVEIGWKSVGHLAPFLAPDHPAATTAITTAPATPSPVSAAPMIPI
jgi:hypothetical protein